MADNVIRLAWGPGWDLVLRSDVPVPAEAYGRLAGAVRALDVPPLLPGSADA